MESGETEEYRITSFVFRVFYRDHDFYLAEPSEGLFRFFGTTEESYRNGILTRISRDLGRETLEPLRTRVLENLEKKEEIHFTYQSRKGDGSPCTIQMDAYPAGEDEEGHPLYNVADMDITQFLKSKAEEKKAREERDAVMNLTPVGLGIYRIAGNYFELLYINEGYHLVHHTTQDFFDRMKGQDALLRIYSEDRAKVLAEWKETRKDTEHHLFDVDYRIMGEDGRLHWVRLQGRVFGQKDGVYICYAAYTNIDRQMEAEEKAAESETRLAELLQKIQSYSVLYRYGEDGNLETCVYSDALCRLVGGTEQECRTYYTLENLDWMHSDDRAAVRTAFRRTRDEGLPSDATFRIHKLTDGYVWLAAHFTRTDIGNSRYLCGVYADVDEIKKKEETLEAKYTEQMEYLESVSGNAVSTIRLNVTQDIVESVSGIDFIPELGVGKNSIEEMNARAVKDILRTPDRAAFSRMFNRQHILEDYRGERYRSRLEYYIQREGKQPQWVAAEMNLIRRPHSEDVIAFISIRDINLQKISEIIAQDILVRQYDYIAYVRGQQNSAVLVMRNPGTSIFKDVFSTDDYMKTVVRHARAYVVPEEAEGCIDFLNPAKAIEALKDRDSITHYVNSKDEHGILHYKKLDYYYLDRENGLLALMQSDMTDMQRAQVEEAEKLRIALIGAEQASVAKTQFLSRMSHEIRTPMNAIIGMDAIALREKSLTPSMEDHLQKIGISARYLLSLINDILDMSRIESGKMALRETEFDFREMIDSINTIFYTQCSSNSIDYECVVKGYIEKKYVGDSTKLQQILVNILGNSVKFTPHGGKIHFLVEQVSHTEEKARMRFTIADTGIGIDESYIPHIFETFSQENGGSTSVYGGSGLGLAISRNIARMMDGDITVHSVKNMGSDFTVEVTLGTSKEEVPFWKDKKRLPNGLMRKMKTLIVDDDVIVCEHTGSLLGEAGIAAEWVTSGAAAVSRVREENEARQDYQLILLDWKMPDMDGIETARQIRKIVGPEVTIIIMTGYDWAEIEKGAVEAGVDSFMRKPVAAAAVIEKYNELTEHRHPAEEMPDAESFDFSGKNVLLVEDNDINAEIAQALLEMKGLHVDRCRNGVEAIETFTMAEPGRYSAILMDVRMPVMNGLEAARAIRQLHKAEGRTIPIIAMTANAFDEDIRQSLDSGMNAHLAKPIEPETLYATLQHFMDAADAQEKMQKE